jgi:hypothetical protein
VAFNLPILSRDREKALRKKAKFTTHDNLDLLVLNITNICNIYASRARFYSNMLFAFKQANPSNSNIENYEITKNKLKKQYCSAMMFSRKERF